MLLLLAQEWYFETTFLACKAQCWGLNPWKAEVMCVHAQSCPTVCDPMDWSSPTRLLCPWNFSGKSTRMGCHFLLQGIFPTQGLNAGLLCRQADKLPLSYVGSPGNISAINQNQGKPSQSLCSRGRDREERWILCQCNLRGARREGPSQRTGSDCHGHIDSPSPGLNGC